MMKYSNRPFLLMMLVTLVVFGGALVYFTMEYLSQVTKPDITLAESTGPQLRMLLLVVTMLAGMPAVGMGAYVMYLGSRIRVTQQWPPAGMGFGAETPVMLGDRATFVGWAVTGLGFVLVVCGVTLPVVGWKFGNLVQ
ncbi:hypothetical protein [Candidatus Nitrospira neomarina]|uniref:Uncharacterized protein n=1 Tax=Candidatus Nitrospira neomarina TaxID=3020899 RepID=A0AA96GQQ9_9BACT|nr:hypothetical protein [Candidatus Nitrospira neomarina]WNM62404.1 hypothetical protein PQG83_01275 [Candidatus Nitrospira neomarina]